MALPCRKGSRAAVFDTNRFLPQQVVPLFSPEDRGFCMFNNQLPHFSQQWVPEHPGCQCADAMTTCVENVRRGDCPTSAFVTVVQERLQRSTRHPIDRRWPQQLTVPVAAPPAAAAVLT